MENKRKDSDISHDGHRQRLTDLVLKAGIDNVSNIQAVEFFLTYIFPRGDVNPLAHRLLNVYGNFANILDAEINDLVKIEGLNERSAKKIKLFNELTYLYSSSRMEKKISLKNKEEFMDYIEQLMRFQATENLFLFAIDNSCNLIQKRRFNMKNVKEVGINPFDLYDFISSTKLSYLAIAHNHPNGLASPSKNDEEAVAYIKKLIENLNCNFIDSFIIGVNGIYSAENDCLLRHFESVDNIIDFLDTKNKKTQSKK